MPSGGFPSCGRSRRRAWKRRRRADSWDRADRLRARCAGAARPPSTQGAPVVAHDGSAAALVFRGTAACRAKLRDLWSNLTWPWPTLWQGESGVHSGYRRHLNLIPRCLPPPSRRRPTCRSSSPATSWAVHWRASSQSQDRSLRRLPSFGISKRTQLVSAAFDAY